MPPKNDEDSPNPLLLSFVKRWYDEAKDRGTKAATVYKRAYDSLRACPLIFDHPSELQTLKGFGPKLCERVTVELQKYCNETGHTMPEHPLASKKRKTPGGGRAGARAAAADDDDDDAEHAGPSAPPPKKPRSVKPYVPSYGSGSYAIMIALSSMPEDATAPGMNKDDLIAAAQPHCKSSFTAAEPGSYYTAWNSMKTLLTKELVYERGRPTKRYALTEEGWDTARRMQKTVAAAVQNRAAATEQHSNAAAHREPMLRQDSFTIIPRDTPDADTLEPKPNYSHIVSNGQVVVDDFSLPSFTPIVLPPGSFTVHLLLDNREVRAKNDRDYMQTELVKKGIQPLTRSLELGDAQWVAKCADPGLLPSLGAEGDEVVLDYIAERKRLDDLISSIKDRRFHEQKFRLRRSGVRNVTYIIEEMALDLSYGSKEEMVESAIASTQVVDGFMVKKTQRMDDTIRYLARMTEMLKKKYENKELKVIPTRVITAQNYLPLVRHLRSTEPGTDYYISYPAFASLASKSETLTLRDLFLKMLMCIRGVTGEKAIEIQKIWKTPNEFVKAFEQCGAGAEGKSKVQMQDLVSKHLGNKVKSKQIGKTLSKKIAEIWGDVEA